MNEQSNKENNTAIVPLEEIDIRSRIYFIRGQEVMLDYDLASLYGVETKRLNERVKRNIKRFPESFRFQLNQEEYDNLRSQNATSSDEYGGRRYLPYAFTEQGIAMLSAILRTDVAIDMSIRIMESFVEMRRFIASNALLLEKITAVELKQIEFQKDTEEKLDEVFAYISDHSESEQKIFFDGQIYDAFSLLISLVQKAKKSIILIDGYVDVGTLNIIAKKSSGVDVRIHTYSNTRLTKADIKTFNSQYPSLIVTHGNQFHDRFLILDQSIVYHIGASIKDAGKKCFGINLIEDPNAANDLISKL